MVAMTDWNPESYARFADLRLRPALDLLSRVAEVPAGDIIDLGCGSGVVGAALAMRWPDRRIIGVDASPAMLEKARVAGGYAALVKADAATWAPEQPPAVIFSNAALHWLEAHDALMPRLVSLLMPGGTLAVQMPRQFKAPSHRFLRDIAASLYPDRFDFADYEPPVKSSESYWDLLAPLGRVEAWETDYVQCLPASAEGHPVRLFTQSTAMRPFLEKLQADEGVAFVHAYEAALAAAYPLRGDGSVLFPFRRCFFTVTRP
jgi:trans-aconitate 2-methyltransferase